MQGSGTGVQTPAGWYADPYSGGQRYWDGEQWTEHTSGVQPTPPPVQQHYQQQPPNWPPQQPYSPPKKSGGWKWVVGAIVAVIVVIAATSGSSTTEEDGGGEKAASSGQNESADAKAKANEDPEKPNNATDDFTPHVGSKGQITVDGIVYSVSSVETTKSIGDATIGTAEEASGTYVVVDIAAHSTKGETATLLDNTFKVTYDGGPEYSADTDGTVALTLADDAGADPFFLTDIQPDGDERGKVVFDVPAAAINKKLELRVNELGFGETHGFIRLKL